MPATGCPLALPGQNLEIVSLKGVARFASFEIIPFLGHQGPERAHFLSFFGFPVKSVMSPFGAFNSLGILQNFVAVTVTAGKQLLCTHIGPDDFNRR